MIIIDTIRQLCEAEALRWTNHVLIRLIQRKITTDDVVCALLNGEIIEQYPTDYPYSSCLVLGIARNGETLHIVCGVGEDELWLITAYYPNHDEWTNDYRERKEI